MVMPLRIVFFSDGYIGKTTVLLNCNQTNQQPIFDVVNTSEAGEFVSEDRMVRLKLRHRILIRIISHSAFKLVKHNQIEL